MPTRLNVDPLRPKALAPLDGWVWTHMSDPERRVECGSQGESLDWWICWQWKWKWSGRGGAPAHGSLEPPNETHTNGGKVLCAPAQALSGLNPGPQFQFQVPSSMGDGHRTMDSGLGNGQVIHCLINGTQPFRGWLLCFVSLARWGVCVRACVHMFVVGFLFCDIRAPLLKWGISVMGL